MSNLNTLSHFEEPKRFGDGGNRSANSTSSEAASEEDSLVKDSQAT